VTKPFLKEKNDIKANYLTVNKNEKITSGYSWANKKSTLPNQIIEYPKCTVYLQEKRRFRGAPLFSLKNDEP